MFRPNPTAGYHPHIKAFCTPDIMSCYPLGRIFHGGSNFSRLGSTFSLLKSASTFNRYSPRRCCLVPRSPLFRKVEHKRWNKATFQFQFTEYDKKRGVKSRAAACCSMIKVLNPRFVWWLIASYKVTVSWENDADIVNERNVRLGQPRSRFLPSYTGCIDLEDGISYLICSWRLFAGKQTREKKAALNTYIT